MGRMNERTRQFDLGMGKRALCSGISRILLFHLRESAFICGLILPSVSALGMTVIFI
jgi:hypothetical protein